MLRIEREVSLNEWERQTDAFAVYSDQILDAFKIDKNQINCCAVQTIRCAFLSDVESSKIYFDLQVLRYFFRFNAVVNCGTASKTLFQALTFLCFAQELLLDNISLLAGEAIQLYATQIVPCLEDVDFWESFDYNDAFDRLKIQSMFLFGHEVQHLILFSNQQTRVSSINSIRNRIREISFPDFITEEVLCRIIDNEQILEEFSCDLGSSDVVFAILSKHLNMNPVDAALGLFSAILNQFLLLQIKQLADAAQSDLESATGYLKKQMEIMVVRTQLQSAQIIQLFRKYNISDQIPEYLKKSAAYYTRWSDSTIKYLPETLMKFREAIMSRFKTSQIIPMYMKIDARLEQGESVDRIEGMIEQRILADWDAFDHLISTQSISFS